MRLDQLRSPTGARRPRKRVGRGNATGQGTYAGRGMKGMKARSGGGVRPSFEGGQNPLVKSLPTLRGFTNIFREQFVAVNLDSLASRFTAGSEVDPGVLKAVRLVNGKGVKIKILGRGNLQVPITVKAHRFSDQARDKIEKAGGKAVEI